MANKEHNNTSRKMKHNDQDITMLKKNNTRYVNPKVFYCNRI